MNELISSSSNPIIKEIRSLQEKKGRDRSGLFIAEGLHHVGEAIEAGWKIEALVYSPEILTSEYGKNLIQEYINKGWKVVGLTRERFQALAEKDNPQGILAIVHQKKGELENIDIASLRPGVALISPQDPGNVGTILRTMDAVGSKVMVLIDGGVDPFHPSCIRASMGAIFWIPMVSTTFDIFITWAKTNQVEVIGTSAHAESSFFEMDCNSASRVLLFGNEQKGLSTKQLKACSRTFSLPMRGRSSSLNLAVAAGIFLYFASNKKRR